MSKTHSGEGLRAAARFALFDLDRTLVRRDTARLWIRYQYRRGQASVRDVARVSWWMLQYTLGLVDAEAVAERALRPYVGWLEDDLASVTEEFAQRAVIPLLNKTARERVEHHRGMNHELAIVTSATRYVAGPVARALGIEHLVCTELQVVDGRLTGKVVPPLCYSAGKVTRTEQWLRARGGRLSEAVFYSDSNTDRPLLGVVGTPVLVNPDPLLRLENFEHGWPTERWR